VIDDDEGTTTEGVELSPSPDSAFSALMDILAPEEGSEGAGEGGGETDAPGLGGPAHPAPAEGAGADDGGAAAPADGTEPEPGGSDPASGAPAEPGAGATPAWEADAASYDQNWADVLGGLETRQSEEFQASSLAEVQTEYPKYFDALQQHPRMLVNKEVPSLTGEGMERLRDSADAAEWQEAVKLHLLQEIKDRTSRKMDDVRPMMETLHSAVKLFQDNSDLVPGAKQFDQELAERFVTMAAPYELRVEGKLSGYTIPVQPLVNQIRSELAAQRGAAAVTPTAQQQRAAEQQRTPQGQFAAPAEVAPQAGIPSKAGGAADEPEDFSTLFGTIGLPGLRI